MVGGAYFMVGRINPIQNLTLKKYIGVIIAAVIVSGITLVPGYLGACMWIAPLAMALFILFLLLLFRNEFSAFASEIKS